MTTVPTTAPPRAGLLAVLAPGAPAGQDQPGPGAGFAALVDALVVDLGTTAEQTPGPAPDSTQVPTPVAAPPPSLVEPGEPSASPSRDHRSVVPTLAAPVEEPVEPPVAPVATDPDAPVTVDATALVALGLPVPVPVPVPLRPVAPEGSTATVVPVDEAAPATPLDPVPALPTTDRSAPTTPTTAPLLEAPAAESAPGPVATPAAPEAAEASAPAAAPPPPATPTTPVATAAAPAVVPSTAPAPEVRGAVQHVVDQVTRLVESASGSSTRNLVLRLDPGSLGEVEVRLRVHAGVVRVHLTAGDAAVREALTLDAGRLLDLLGTGADDVRVVVAELPRGARDLTPQHPQPTTPDRLAEHGAGGQQHPGSSDGQAPSEHGRPTRTSDVTRATDGTQRPSATPPTGTAADPRTTSPRRLDVSA